MTLNLEGELLIRLLNVKIKEGMVGLKMVYVHNAVGKGKIKNGKLARVVGLVEDENMSLLRFY